MVVQHQAALNNSVNYYVNSYGTSQLRPPYPIPKIY